MGKTTSLTVASAFAILLAACSGPVVVKEPYIPDIPPGNYWWIPTDENGGCNSLARPSFKAKVGFLDVIQDDSGTVTGHMEISASGYTYTPFDSEFDVVLVPQVPSVHEPAFTGALVEGGTELGRVTMYWDGRDERGQAVLDVHVRFTERYACPNSDRLIHSRLRMPEVKEIPSEDVRLEFSGVVGNWPAGHTGYLIPRGGDCGSGMCLGYFGDGTARVEADGSFTIRFGNPIQGESMSVCGVSYFGLQVLGFDVVDSTTGESETRFMVNHLQEYLVLHFSRTALSGETESCKADFVAGWNARAMFFGALASGSRSIPLADIAQFSMSTSLAAREQSARYWHLR